MSPLTIQSLLMYFGNFTKLHKLLLILEQGFPTRGVCTPWWCKAASSGYEMVIQIFVLHYCIVMLSLFCANHSAHSVSNYSMPSAQSSIQPKMMLISKKKRSTCDFSRNLKIGPGHVVNLSHVKIF